MKYIKIPPTVTLKIPGVPFAERPRVEFVSWVTVGDIPGDPQKRWFSDPAWHKAWDEICDVFGVLQNKTDALVDQLATVTDPTERDAIQKQIAAANTGEIVALSDETCEKLAIVAKSLNYPAAVMGGVRHLIRAITDASSVDPRTSVS